MYEKEFTDLGVWKTAREFRQTIQALTKSFPADEKFMLTNQIIRSSRSISANVAEGHGRHYYQENIRFCRIAKGSLKETLDHLIVAFDCKYITLEELKTLQQTYVKLLKSLNGYISYLKKSKVGSKNQDTDQ
jgi:four helix bundle protein